MLRPLIVLIVLSAATVNALADGPADNNPATVRRVPKLGIEVPAEKRAQLEAGLAKLRTAIDAVRNRNDAVTRELWPDLEIFHKAVQDALAYQEFFDVQELAFADKLLAIGQDRAEQLAKGEAPWTTSTGLIVRGYVSKIDQSVQPYGLVVPGSYSGKGPGRYRTDLWFHGRGETLSELNFLRDRLGNPGSYTPEDTLVLHPYGRYCNAAKFAGEIDGLEALESVKRRYRVDENRISVRGFSMGGAATWHFAVHYSDRWFAANPGAGFSETPDFLRVFQKEELKPQWWEKKLWQWYDCPAWALNLKNCPTVAYSGELDIQKQAADVMEPAVRKAGLELRHIIAPGTKHSIHPAAAEEVERRMGILAKFGQQPAHDLRTMTLRYNRCGGLTVDELEEHWAPARIWHDYLPNERMLVVRCDNVTGFTLDYPPNQETAPAKLHVVAGGDWQPLDPQTIQEGLVGSVPPQTDRSLRISAHQSEGKWKLGKRPDDGGPRKQHGLQGPIDDAFLDSFIFVRPTGKPWNEQAGKWSAAELDRAIEHWRRQFRGQARVKLDTAITDDDRAGANLILWGDPGSNQELARLAGKLPIQWTRDQIAVDGRRQFTADKHALVAIYPNPLSKNRYVVLNSSFTYRDYAYLNNARQVPMLPDWAVVDLTTPPNTVWPGKIVAADFFDERWQLNPPHGE